MSGLTLEPGLYIWRNEKSRKVPEYIVLQAKETTKSFTLTLKANTVKWDAPQIEDMFDKSDTVRINKDSSNHAIVVDKGWFALYPYRVGAVYLFNKLEEGENVDGI